MYERRVVCLCESLSRVGDKYEDGGNEGLKEVVLGCSPEEHFVRPLYLLTLHLLISFGQSVMWKPKLIPR